MPTAASRFWDPARNYWKKKGNINVQDRLPGYVLYLYFRTHGA